MLDISINHTTHLKSRDYDQHHLGFGKIFTDHMFVMDYDQGQGWHDARIVPYAPITLEPSALIFHYAQECFEGLKAYRKADGTIQLFRPEKNAHRMQTSHQRLGIPLIPEADFVQACKALVRVDRDWVPSVFGASLYLRPFTIATEAVLGVKASNQYKFMIIASPSGSYYANGINPIRIYVEDHYVRAVPGGTGHVKCGGNYAASILAGSIAHEKGYDQVLWLDSQYHKYVEEVGSMNIFFKIANKLYTAPCVGTVLPGVTRMSCIELLRSWGYDVCEDRLSIDDVMEAGANGTLEEVFGTGTAAVISPVGELAYHDRSIIINDAKIGTLTQRLYDTLTGIQWGKLPDTFGWTQSIDD